MRSLGRVQCRLDLLLRLLGDSWEAAEGLIQVEAILSFFVFFFPASLWLLPVLPVLGNPANEASVADKCDLALHTSL